MLEYSALVYTISAHDGRTVRARTKLYFRDDGRGGYIAGIASTTEAVLQMVFMKGSTRLVELHITAPGFDKYRRKVILRPGELTIWSDIVLEPITERSAAAVVGRVRLENENENLEGLVIYVDQEAATLTDASGYFVADPVRAGKLILTTRKDVYPLIHAEVTVVAGQEHSCELIGYRKRFAHVRWAYQPNGTRQFDGDTRTGTAVLSSDTLSRMSFARGFKQVYEKSDFRVTQEKDRLVLDHFDISAVKSPASVLVKNISFDELQEAPKSGYTRSKATLRPGDLYVFRCYDGKHYAMMEILDITDELPSREP